jgi:hypothetical protein
MFITVFKKPATGRYLEPDESSPKPHELFLAGLHPLAFRNQNVTTFITLYMYASCEVGVILPESITLRTFREKKNTNCEVSRYVNYAIILLLYPS